MVLSRLQSILVTTLLSFIAPILLVGSILALLFSIGWLPYLTQLGHIGVRQTLEFLAIFGSGDAVWGILIIGLTCGLVGSLFDLSNFYLYQSMREH